jgi:hypothetical protein
MAVWYSLLPFGIFFLFWYVWTKKNLATLASNVEAAKSGLIDWLRKEKLRIVCKE